MLIDTHKVENKFKKSYAGCCTIVKISLRDGRFHEGIGYSESVIDQNGVGFEEIRKVIIYSLIVTFPT